MHFKQLTAVPILLALAACNPQTTSSTASWVSAMNNRAPTETTIYVCHAFGCQLKYGYRFTKADLSKLKRILRAGSKNPQAERKAIGNAVAWFEKRVGPIIGSDKDKGGLDMKNAGVPGQMDCIDEASNTTSLISFAQKHGFLKYHKVQSPVARGYFLDGRYPHATAVILETESNERYAVDSWIYDNGVFPKIKPLKDWMAETPSRG
nr:hypothetical protein [uncultured Cohaesibacter sp.]